MYITNPTRRRRRPLGDLSTDLLGTVSGSGVSSSPFLWIGLALLGWFVIDKGRDAISGITHKPRRRRRQVPAMTAAVYAAGAGAAGYLVGKYTGI